MFIAILCCYLSRFIVNVEFPEKNTTAHTDKDRLF